MTQAIFETIKSLISDHKIVLFMKGTKESPMCGFSARVIQILSHLNADFFDVNVLADENMREGIKQFSDWPTVPQLYIDGEFIGGCDIVTEIFTQGELQTLIHETQ